MGTFFQSHNTGTQTNVSLRNMSEFTEDWNNNIHSIGRHRTKEIPFLIMPLSYQWSISTASHTMRALLFRDWNRNCEFFKIFLADDLLPRWLNSCVWSCIRFTLRSDRSWKKKREEKRRVNKCNILIVKVIDLVFTRILITINIMIRAFDFRHFYVVLWVV